MGVFRKTIDEDRAIYDAIAASAERAAVAVRVNTIPLDVHDRVVAQLERQLASAQRTSERHVAREVHEAVVAGLMNQLSAANAMIEKLQAQLQSTVTETLAIKRGELNMGDKDFKFEEAMSGLGPKTEAAIEEFAAGDPQTRKYLIHQAKVDALGYKARGSTPEEVDGEVAELIRRGDVA
jgi:hypothetical protein